MIVRELSRVPHVWDKWWTLESLHEGALCGRFQVWAVGPLSDVEGFLMTSIFHYPAGPMLETIVAFGNHLEECMPVMMAQLQMFASKCGCARIEVRGRAGWERKLWDYGFRREGVLLYADVHEGGLH
jgi:hypothetical protein